MDNARKRALHTGYPAFKLKRGVINISMELLTHRDRSKGARSNAGTV